MKRIQSVQPINYTQDFEPKIPESTFLQSPVNDFNKSLVQLPLIDMVLPQPHSQKLFYAKVSTPTKKKSKTQRVRRTKRST